MCVCVCMHIRALEGPLRRALSEHCEQTAKRPFPLSQSLLFFNVSKASEASAQSACTRKDQSVADDDYDDYDGEATINRLRATLNEAGPSRQRSEISAVLSAGQLSKHALTLFNYLTKSVPTGKFSSLPSSSSSASSFFFSPHSKRAFHSQAETADHV